MNKDTKIGLIAVTIYLAMAIFTFGNVAARSECAITDDLEAVICEWALIPRGVFAGVFWPVYWPLYWSWRLQS